EIGGARTFGAIVERFAGAAIAVDIPIGLPEGTPWRRAEREAVRLVHPATVFPTYPLAAYRCKTHAEAVALCRASGWPGISRQSYGLWPRMQEVEPAAAGVYEVHPELSFWKMNGAARLAASKHMWNGFFERRRLLERHGIVVPERLPEDARAADVLDAAAAAWTARRIALHQHRTLPADPEPWEPTIAY